jgi:hypothetical protein
MRTQFIASTALLAAVLGSGLAWAQSAPTPLVLTDTAPLPAEDRSSLGAVVMPESPVLAQREMATQTLARTQQLMTTSMGAGPAIAVQSDDGRQHKILRTKPKASKKQQ